MSGDVDPGVGFAVEFVQACRIRGTHTRTPTGGSRCRIGPPYAAGGSCIANSRQPVRVTASTGHILSQTRARPLARRHLIDLATVGDHTQAELAELFDVSRTAVYRQLHREPRDNDR